MKILIIFMIVLMASLAFAGDMIEVTRRGNTIYFSDGRYFEIRGNTMYGSDGNIYSIRMHQDGTGLDAFQTGRWRNSGGFYYNGRQSQGGFQQNNSRGFSDNFQRGWNMMLDLHRAKQGTE